MNKTLRLLHGEVALPAFFPAVILPFCTLATDVLLLLHTRPSPEVLPSAYSTMALTVALFLATRRRLV